MHAHNTFDQPNVVHLSEPVQVPAKGQTLRVSLPAGSVVRVLTRQ